MVRRILLLGAGFSHNWSAPLAAEMFEALLQQREVQDDEYLKEVLWRHRAAGGFENALAQVQQDFKNNAAVSIYKDRLDKFQAAIDKVFAQIDKSFATIPSWEFTRNREQTLLATLIKFDAIFTLNQDLSFERFYFNDNVSLESRQRWNGVILPGIRENRDASFPYDPSKSRWMPLDESAFSIEARFQSYFKLHGSWRWFDSAGQQLMIMGASKASAISGHPILKWYQTEFARYLEGDTRLLVIGYGFKDLHINEVIANAGSNGGLKIFLVDPLGVDVSNPDRGLPLQRENPFKNMIVGTSTRTIRQIFGDDVFAHDSVSQFVDGNI